MAEVTINNSPFHTQAQITYPYGIADSGYTCKFHTGVDIVTKTSDREVYAVESGTVNFVKKELGEKLGIQVQFRSDSGRFWRYCHLELGSNNSIQVGQRVDTNTVLGKMGATGNVTGPHLHLECSSTASWNCSNFINPCSILGIPNEDNLIINYSGEAPSPPSPPSPPISSFIKEKKFKWAIFTRVIRNRRKLS